MNYPSDSEAKALIIRIGKNMRDARFVTANDGNITVRVGDDAVWATPTGVNKGELEEKMLIKVRISDSAILEGTWKATTELEMHLNAYRVDDTLMSTAHAHPLHLTTLACAGIDLDMPTTPAAVLISGRVPVIPYVCSGSQGLADCIKPYVKDFHVVNLGNHGPIAWGHTPNEAWYRLEDAEASAELALSLLKLGRLRPINSEQVEELISFHHMPVSAPAHVAATDSTANQNPAIKFSDLLSVNL